MIGGAEERRGVAAAAALAAVVTGREAADRARHVGAAAGDDRHAEAFGRAHHDPFGAARRGRRQKELAPRQRVRVVVAAVDADQLVDLVVIRRDVLVGDRPGNLPAVARGSLEIEVAVAQADASPDVRLAAMAPDAGQREGTALGGEIRLFFGVEKEAEGLLAASGALAPFPGFNVRPEFGSIEFRSGIEEQHGNALTRQVPGGHSARGAAADHDDRMFDRLSDDLHESPPYPG